MLVDANVLLYAVDARSPHHSIAATWLERALNGAQRVGIPWQSIGAFVRIATHPRVTARPLTGTEAWRHVDRWLTADPTWIPPAGERTARVLGQLIAETHITANLVPDAQLAALALEHGLAVVSADTDFARFPVTWINPLT
ncbi:MAG: TA system VapC family ribonuclease toxin [Ilumatobacteraceae bacterium]